MSPSMLLGTGENWTMAKTISATQFLMYETGKGYGSIIPNVTEAGLDDLTRTLDHKIRDYVDHYLKEMEKFFPQDPSKVMVSCADSQVRIIQGVNVIGKYKSFRSTGSYCSAFFTSDGRQILSASEDSNVYVWNCVNQDYQDPSQIVAQLV